MLSHINDIIVPVEMRSMPILEIDEDTLQIEAVECTDSHLIVHLQDGRQLHTPLRWYPKLLCATSAQRQNYRVVPFGDGIHWPELDEDLSVQGMLRGIHQHA
jgi:Protein of unknown function (DUF2442)